MRKNSNYQNGNGSTPNMIAAGTIIKGDIQSNGDFRIEGELIGSVRSKGKIVVGESGKIEGEIYCRNADICGRVKARLEASELTNLSATCNFEGEIVTGKISIEPGAVFSGSCTMADSKKQPTVEAPKK